MQVAFHKMHGAGNDFVVLDARQGVVLDARQQGVLDARQDRVLDLAPAMIARLCHRQTGIGCDQLVLLGDAPAGEVAVRFFNNDGSESGTCGNASRCVVSLVTGGEPGAALILHTLGGSLAGRMLEAGQVEVDMGRPRLGWRDIPLASETDTLHLALAHDPAACSMGNPHATFFGHPGDPAVVGPLLERDPLFPERANIGFATVLSPNRLRLRVWERGTGLTLACGSGACAAAVNAARRGLTGRRVTVELDGGTLTIDWGADDHVRMTGPAVIAYTGTVELDQYR